MEIGVKRGFFKDALNRRTLCMLIVLFFVIAPLLLKPFQTFLLTRILFLSLVSMSFILLIGYGGMLSLVQISFFGVAGYVIGIGTLKYNMPTHLVIPLAVLIPVILSGAFGIIAIRTERNYFIMMTVAFAQLLFFGSLQWSDLTAGYDGLTGIGSPTLFGHSFKSRTELYYFTLIPSAICYLLLRRITQSPFGIALQGVRDSAKKMSALGFNVQLYRYLAIVMSGAFAGVAGVLGAYFYGMIAPDMLNLSSCVMVLFIALLGGVTRLEGALVGSLIYVLLDDFFSQYTQRYQTIIGIFFVLIVLFLPNGIIGIKFKTNDTLYRLFRMGENPNGPKANIS